MRLPARTPLVLAAALVATPIVLGALPGAIAAPKRKAPTTAPVAPPAARVVVADIDSGINPYHADYYRGPSEVTPAVLAEFPGIQTITLTRTGDLAADFATDRATWAAVELGRPYWFAGTNVIGISFDAETPTRIFADAGDEHGVGTSAAVLDANPEAVVLFVEGVNADSETYAFTHPAVDVVTTSYGIPGSPPVPFHLTASYEGAVERGKLHFGAADNSPALSPTDGTSGPWWSIGVAGFHETDHQEGGSGGRETLSGNLVDVVSDFTQTLPYCSDCESGRQSVSGTSFATPRAAGTASKVLLEARRAAGHVGGPVVKPGIDSLIVAGSRPMTPWQLRRAFEEAAAYPALEAYDPTSAVVDDLGALPVNPVAPYAQVGWGVFAPAAVDGALAQLGVRGTPAAPKPADACAVNNAGITARHAYWDSVAIGSESFGTAAGDPYLYCS